MSDYLIEEYSKMIKCIDQSKIRTRNEKNKRLTMQFYSKGSDFERHGKKLMIVGRAVNGWDKECEWNQGYYANSSPIDLVSKAYEKSLINQLEWVGESWSPKNKFDDNGKRNYNTAKSPFWQLTKHILKNITPEKEWDENNWALRTIWSNLYKVAPAIGGNPNNTLCKLQLEFCKNILNYEINLNKPKYILFITGENWFNDFKDCLPITNEYNPVIQICKRPEFNSPVLMAEEICNEFLNNNNKNSNL